MNLEIITNTFVAIFLYNLILSSIGKVILNYFLTNSDTIQKEKKTFQDRIRDEMNKKNEV